MEVTWTRLKSVNVGCDACVLALVSCPQSRRGRGWWRGPGERKIRSKEIPDLACSGEMTSSLVTGIRAVDNKIKCIKDNNI